MTFRGVGDITSPARIRLMQAITSQASTYMLTADGEAGRRGVGRIMIYTWNTEYGTSLEPLLLFLSYRVLSSRVVSSLLITCLVLARLVFPLVLSSLVVFVFSRLVSSSVVSSRLVSSHWCRLVLPDLRA